MRNVVFAFVLAVLGGAAAAQLSEKQVREEYFAIKRLLAPVYSAPAKDGARLVAFDCGYQDGVPSSTGSAPNRRRGAPTRRRARRTPGSGGRRRQPAWSRFRDLPQDGRIDAAGPFRYQVRWPDGATKAGRVDFDKVLKQNETVL